MTNSLNKYASNVVARIAREKSENTCAASLAMLEKSVSVFNATRVEKLFSDSQVSETFAMQRVNAKDLIDIKSINRVAYFAQYAAKTKLYSDKNNDRVTLATIIALADAKLTITRSAIEASITTKSEAKRYKLDAASAAKITHRSSINDAKTCYRQATLLINLYKILNILKETSTNVFTFNDNAIAKALRASL